MATAVQPRHQGVYMLFCESCRACTDHDAGWDEDGRYRALCQSCVATSEVQPPMGAVVWAVPQGARGPYEEHLWRRMGRRWFRSCRPRSVFHSRVHVVITNGPTAHHPRCRECARRHDD